MAKFLLIVDLPNVIWENEGLSPEFVSQTEKFESTAADMPATTSGSTRLSRNAWLLDAKSSWHFLQRLLDLAKSCKFTYSLLVIEGDVTEMTSGRSAD